ncbi:MAG: ABC transporter substrate-binding protein [Acetatifactor sp.]|nr:ABC transporter substrate-binding protein [Acetatifactor sp.]
MTILAFALFLTGCGKGTTETEEPSAESTVESMEQTVSADIEEPETADTLEQTPGRFQYDYTKLYGGMQGLPLIGEEQAMAEGKTLLTLQTSLPNPWLTDSIAGFNRQSADYFIRLEETHGDDVEERLSVELIAGRGPDIFDGSVFNVNESVLKKGVLVDLAPGLDAMGITDEEYFPGVRALRMGDGVYGIRSHILPHGYSIRESVLGSREQPDIETLVEKLYTYPDQKAVWRAYGRSEVILEYLLSGSEDLWGMIDWEKGTCDFSGELFSKMLEIAKRYADPEGKSLEEEERWLVNFYIPVQYSRKQVESEGKVIINYLFDDGNYPAYERIGEVLMLNANSEHQEGAWEFLKYVLDEEGQGYSASISSLAVNREMSRSYFEYSLKLLEEGRMQTTADLTPEAIEDLYAFTEQGRDMPLRTKEILDIIYEEAQSFCDGGKPLEEVCDVIQRRVQIYISETM